MSQEYLNFSLSYFAIYIIVIFEHLIVQKITKTYSSCLTEVHNFWPTFPFPYPLSSALVAIILLYFCEFKIFQFYTEVRSAIPCACVWLFSLYKASSRGIHVGTNIIPFFHKVDSISFCECAILPLSTHPPMALRLQCSLVQNCQDIECKLVGKQDRCHSKSEVIYSNL